MTRKHGDEGARGFARGALLILITLALTAGTVGLAACGSDDSGDSGGGGGGTTTQAATGKPVKIAYLLATEAAGYPQGMKKAAQGVAPENNAQLTFFDGQFDPGKQVGQCQDAVAQGTFDAIVALPAASPAMVPCARAAQAKKLPLISTNTPIGTDLENIASPVPGVTSQVLVPAATYGGAGPDQGVGTLVPKMCEKQKAKGKCKIGFIIGVRVLALSDEMEKGLKQLVSENSDSMELVGSCEGGYQRQGGLKCMQDLLQKDPELNVVLSMSDDMMLGAENALKSANKTLGKDVVVGTQGGSVQGVQRLRAGQWYGTILTLAASEGAIPVELATKAARGEKVPNGVDPNKEAGLPLVLDQENLEQYPDFKGEFNA